MKIFMILILGNFAYLKAKRLYLNPPAQENLLTDDTFEFLIHTISLEHEEDRTSEILSRFYQFS